MKNLFFFTYALLFFAFQSASQPAYIAHRGASWLAPENTVASARLGWELGADAVEVDIHLSRDKRIMVIHDKTTGRTCSGENLKIKSSLSEQLRTLDAGSLKDEKFRGEKIPFLTEIIDLIPENKKLVVELKSGSDVIPHLKRILEENEKTEQLIFISFNWKTIVKMKREFPENPCYWLAAVRPGLKRRMKQAAEAGLEGINLKYSLIREGIMDYARALDLEVLAWSVDDPEEAQRLTELGVSGITTNRPKWLKEQVAGQ